MITIHRVGWSNFLSTGNIVSEVILDQHHTTFVCGINGSGKSTIMDALCYALFNKAFRKINKPQLINTITDKHMLVEVEFTTNSRKYLIRRGLKPIVFEIFQDGKLINQSADSREYQQILEANILKINYKTFCQIVVLGMANFTAFMQLSTQQRREIIEDLLDLQVFSTMNLLLRERNSNNKSALSECETQIKLLTNTIELNKKHREQQSRNTEAIVDRKRQQIAEKQSEGDTNEINIERLENDKLSFQPILSRQGRFERRMADALDLQVSLENKIKRVQKQIEFYNLSTLCSTCKQTISQNHKENQLAAFEEKNNTLLSRHAVVAEVVQKLQQEEKIYQQTNQTISEINNQINISINNNRIDQALINALNKEIVAIEKDDNQIEQDDTVYDKIDEQRKIKQQLLNERELINVASMLLKDGGIKTEIIRQYVPIINSLINKYLEMMEFFCQFEINEQFEEVIKSRFRDEFSYESFSQGEKMRIDLALLFSWREISRMRNSASINLLVLDEIMDGPLDAAGTEEFTKIVTAAGNSNIIVISHKDEQIGDKFDRKIKFHKIKNFSSIMES